MPQGAVGGGPQAYGQAYNPVPTFGGQQIREAQNVAAANSVPAISDLRNQAARPGISMASGALQGQMGGAAGQAMAQGAAQAAQIGNQMGWQNAQNMLGQQQIADQYSQGLGQLGNQQLQNQFNWQNQSRGNMLGFLQNAYRGM